LVDISVRGDKTCFVQVYYTLRELKDNLYTSWKRNEPLSSSLTEQGNQSHEEATEVASFISRLPDGSIAELSHFLHLLRTSPEFLVDRLKRLLRPQLEALSARPKYSNFQTPGLPSASRARNQHKRNISFSNTLKDCALSFERSDPLSFLLFNVYGSSLDPDSAEYNLRLDVWSSVCAQLFVESEDNYEPLFNEVFTTFAALHEWRAKQRLELFLMDLLQRGAFLLRSTEDSNNSPELEHAFLDPLSTKEAESFINDAVRDLFEILNDQDGGLPYGALHFGSAVLGKLDVKHHGSFRGHFFFQWFFCEFLRETMIHPEASLVKTPLFARVADSK
jgi:chromatin assembly factor 1 subunit A